MDTRGEIAAQFAQVAREQGRHLCPLNESVELIESGLDSLCLAIVVARLVERLGVDPFSASEGVVCPVTFGEFVRLYENASRPK